MTVSSMPPDTPAGPSTCTFREIPGAGELTVLAGGMIGGVLGFLWFNCHPAQVFMGDTGSLPLGGLLGLLAVVARQELLLVIVGGVFVAEAASVILQVGYYNWRRRRIFLLRPAASPFPVPRLGGKPDRRPLLDRRRAVRLARRGQFENKCSRGGSDAADIDGGYGVR